MARCSAFIFTAIFCIISVNSLIPERNLSDPSVEIIKHQDAEEGYDFRVKDKTIDANKDSKDNLPLYPLELQENEGTDDVTNIQTVESEAGNSENEQTDTKATPETANKQPELIIHSYDLNPQRDVGYLIKDEITEPEEDLIGTFHENNIDTNQVEDIHITIENPETNQDIIEQNKREVQEELTNSVDNLNVQEDVNNIESKESAVNNIIHNGVDYYTEEEEQPIYENTKTTITTETKHIEDVNNNVVENEFEEDIPFAKEVPEEVEESPEEFVTDQGAEELEAEEPEVQHTEEHVYEEKDEEEHEEYEPEEEIYEENTNEDTVPLEEQQTEESKIKDDEEGIEVHENEEKVYNELPENAADHEEVIKEDTESSEKTNNEENINEENTENAADEEQMHEEMEHHENNIDEENTEVNEEISEQSESNPNAVFTEVYPILPPSIKEPSRINDAIKAHNRNFDGEEEEKEDGEGEEVTNNISAESDVEPPGFISNVQMSPVRASKEEIKTDERAVCSLPVQTGFCKAYFRRFHFNSKTGECEKFVYGGCGGNGNNFETLRDCENKCVKHSS